MKTRALWGWITTATALALCIAPIADAQRPTTEKGQDCLVKEVRQELVMLPLYSIFDNLEYKVEASVVTLMGQVRTASLKSAAEKTVGQIEGVEQVNNQIEVLPPSTSDDQIRRAVYYALFAENSPLSRYGWGAVPPIHIIVNGGRVTLIGIVYSDADKTTAALLVQKVPGIFSVTNNLRVSNR
jgi:osmotically-inducible protein OsmY